MDDATCMTARFTALILSFFIGLPMCWCCIGTDRPQEQEMSCCARKAPAASKEQHAPPQDHNCPCAKHENKRDMASTEVKAPAAGMKLLAEPQWQTTVVETSFPSHFEKNILRHVHGPPPDAAPVYVRHCALLI